MQVVLIGIYLLFSASGLILFKLGASSSAAFSFSQGMLNFKIGYLAILGVLCYGCSFLMYLGLVSKYNLSYIVPVTTGIMYIIILMASIFVFKETVSLTQIFGAMFIIAGVTLINM